MSSGIFPNRVLTNRGIYNLKAAVALSRLCDVRVVAPVPYFPGFIRSERYAWCAAVPPADDVEGFHVEYPRYFVTPKVGRSLHGLTLYLSVAGKYRRIVDEFAPDVILGYFAYPYGFANTLIGRTLGVPVVTFCRGSDIHSMARNWLHARLIAWSLRACTKVFAVSESLKADVVALGVDADHIAVIPNGIETERFTQLDRRWARARLGLSADRRIAVSVSRLSFEKGLDVLIDAVCHLRTPSATVVLVGNGPEKRSLEARAARLGLGDRVHFAGSRPHDEVPLWIAASDVTVLSSRKEGYPNAAVESLACGRPVVATRVGGVPEILTSEALGTMVEPENPADLATALDASFSRQWDAEAIEAAGKARDWDAVAREIRAEFEGIVGTAASPRIAGDSQPPRSGPHAGAKEGGRAER